jgi:hypothetical protein
MLLIGALFAAAGRSELVRVLRGDARDERSTRIETDAMAFTGIVSSSTTLALLLYEWANGRSGTPYVQLSVVGGLAYAAAYALRTRRS